MFKRLTASTLALTAILGLSGCVDPGNPYKPDVYDASEVNMVQAGYVVRIISVQPARVRVNNTQNQHMARNLGALGGGGLGAGLGTAFGGKWAGLGAGLGGALLGGLAGNSIEGSSAIIDAATISYQLPSGSLLTATEVGKTCLWQPGNAQLVVTQRGQTRIQPNSVCVVRH